MSERDVSVETGRDPDSTIAESMFTVSSTGGTTVVSAAGELDLQTRVALRGVLAPLSGVVVVDLSRVTFLDSSAIGVLVAARNRLLASGGALQLGRPQEFVRKTLGTIGLAEWIVD